MDLPTKEQLPVLGVGLSFRPEIAQDLYAHLEEFDFLEVILDNALGGLLDAQFWNTVPQRLPLLGHGVEGSIGSLQPTDTEYLRRLREVAARLHCRWFSEHLAFTQATNLQIGQLMPVQFTEENAVFIADKIRTTSQALGIPFLIENIAYYFPLPGATLSEVDFLTGVLHAARCGLLLDVANLHANALNHGFDPYRFIDRLPAAAVIEIHVAGGAMREGIYIDTHGHALSEPVLSLLDYAIAVTKPNAVVLEREKNFPPVEELVSEVHEVRRLWRKHCGAPRSTPEVTHVAMHV